VQPDLLRKEAFGAFYYKRSTAKFHALPVTHAILLEAATRKSAVDLYAQDPQGWGISAPSFLELMVRWKKRGFIDDNYRCRARVVDATPDAHHLISPLVTNIQLTQACNLKCGHCFVDVDAKSHPDELSTDQFRSLFGELSAIGAPIVILAGGEPMLRKDFWELVESVGEHELDAALCTNATLITDKNAARLVASPLRWYSISLDGADAEMHDSLRGKGRFRLALRGIKALLDAGANDVKIRVTVTAHNAPFLLDFAKIAKELGVHSVVMKPFRYTAEFFGDVQQDLYIDRQTYFQSTKNALENWPEDAPPLSVDDGMPEGPPAWTDVIPDFGCVGGTTHASVIYDGRVVACDAVHDPDDWTLHQHSFKECWDRAPTIQSWRRLEGNESCLSTCENSKKCRGGCRARSLGAGLPMDAPDPWAYCSAEEKKSPRGLIRLVRSSSTAIP
jgi:radical SAM protein with 4Fe4S-binding SPASM domain